MQMIKNKTFDEERALYAAQNLFVQDCAFGNNITATHFDIGAFAQRLDSVQFGIIILHGTAKTLPLKIAKSLARSLFVTAKT